MAELRDAVANSVRCVHQESQSTFPSCNGRDVFGWFHTCYGKSICNQLLFFEQKRTTAPYKFSIDFVYLVYISYFEMERYSNPRAMHIRRSGTR